VWNALLKTAFKADGWFEVSAEGSHHQLKHPTRRGKVTVPHPEADLPIATIKSIEKQAGLKIRR
jgi:predicted RNA binding protein YcfA (HicA-like mRNA interferase family)